MSSWRDTGTSALRLLSRSDRAVFFGYLTAVVLFRVAYAVWYRVDPDEPQHLHVVWAWVHGLVQYRDVFDNHAPLFHMLFAPALALFGERADILVWMRLAQVPLALTLLLIVYLVARTVVPERTAAWVAAAAGLDPLLLPRTVEFRADTLWAVLWLLSLAVVLDSHLTRRRLLLFGVVLGATLAASLKIVPLLVAAAIAAAAPRSWSSVTSLRERLVRLGTAAPLVAAGASVVPGALLAWFASRGALKPLYDCLVVHNARAQWLVGPRALLILAAALAAVIVASPIVARRIACRGREWRATFLLATGFGYLMLLLCVWPLVNGQNYVPVQPLLWLLVVPLVAGGSQSGSRRVYALLAIEMAVLLLSIPPMRHWTFGPHYQAALLADVLRLTDPGDTVIDTKGETVYRHRASPYVLETITRQLLASGRLPDDAPAHLVLARTFVAVNDDWMFPTRTREFLNAHYVPAGRLRVAGALLHPSREGAAEGFDIVIPGPYAIVSPHGPATGLLDGRRVHTAIDVAAGHHVFVLDGPPQAIAVLWARAWNRGFTPFSNGVRPRD
jgi:hypothetical protein